jgi:hypothetical protein
MAGYQQLSNQPQGYGGTGHAPGGPPTQQMSDYRQALHHHPGLLVRQRLRLKNFCVCLLRNKYDIGSLPLNMDPHEAWPDDVFKHQRGLLYAKEESDVLCKICCHRFRAFELKTYLGSNDDQGDHGEILRYRRPFKCPLTCCCFMPWPQEIHTIVPSTNEELGSTVQDWRCMAALCGKFYWRVQDRNGSTTHIIERDVCCNENCFAPNCCCPIHKLNIKDPSEERVVGTVENIFPGCTLRTILCGRMIDNYRLSFPTNASPEDKANILGALFLVDYMVFANADDDRSG